MSNFVPTGFLDLFTAVWELARARELLPDTDFLKDLDTLEAAHRLHVTAMAELRDPPDFVEKPDPKQLLSLRTRRDALHQPLQLCWRDLLQAMGDGKFCGYILTDSGFGAEVPPYVWRASNTLQSAFPGGRVGWLDGTPPVWLEGRVIIFANSFAEWLFGPMPLAPLEDAASSPEPAPEATPEHSERSAGGRPPHAAMDSFIRELLRVADKVDGLPEGPELTRHMLEWASSAYGDDAPSVTTVKDWIARFDYRRPPPKRRR